MLIETLNADFEHNDERGSIIQLIKRGYSQINVITSKAGAIRGGHYHIYNTEAFYIIKGQCRITATTRNEREVKSFKTGDFFRIKPYVFHNFEYIEDSIIISMYSLGIELDNGKMDSYVFA